jgi:hypothetical protein
MSDDEATLITRGEHMIKQYKLGDTVDLSQVMVRISEGSHREYSAGTLFVALENYDGMRKGEVIALKSNDGTSYPYFKSSSASEFCTAWNYLAELPQGKAAKAAKPTVASTKTIYSDGVEVSEEALTFDGKTVTREELKATVARYQEVLRRPVAIMQETKKAPAKKPVAKVATAPKKKIAQSAKKAA